METIEEIKSDYKEGIIDTIKVENTLRSHWAYQKISKKPDQFTDYQREEAFRQYVRSLENNTFHFTFEDMKNFEDWHTEAYTITRRFVYIFLDKQNDKFIGLENYYYFSQQEHVEEVRDAKAYSPLHKDNIELTCNSDGAVLHAFQELLLDTYSHRELQGLSIQQNNDAIDFNAAKKDAFEIKRALETCKSPSDSYPYFEVRDLSLANWYSDENEA